MNWAVDNNAAYDYAADTRGYSLSVIAEYAEPRWAAVAPAEAEEAAQAAGELVLEVEPGDVLDTARGAAGGDVGDGGSRRLHLEL